jgi:hypothetical protein
MDGAGQSNYDDRVAAGWRAFFHALPAGSRILDLCTGNGEVAVIAAEISSVHGKNFAITGIDLADIDPRRFVNRLGIIARDVTFVGKASCETLAYDDGRFYRLDGAAPRRRVRRLSAGRRKAPSMKNPGVPGWGTRAPRGSWRRDGRAGGITHTAPPKGSGGEADGLADGRSERCFAVLGADVQAFGDDELRLDADEVE